MKAAIFSILSALILAEDAPKTSEPQISVEQKLDYQRARADLIDAQRKATVAQKVFEDIVADMAKACGDRGLVADTKGDPECGQEKKKP